MAAGDVKESLLQKLRAKSSPHDKAAEREPVTKRELNTLEERERSLKPTPELRIGGNTERAVHEATEKHYENRADLIRGKLAALREKATTAFALGKNSDRARRDFERSK